MTWLAPVLLWAPTLFDQSVAQVLHRNFPEAQYILIDLASREVVGSRWSAPDSPIPVGSLTKPFVALAAREQTLRCKPAECWLSSGHGRIGMTGAIAESCNSYFLQITRLIDPVRLSGILSRYGLPAPQSTDPETLTGIGANWLIAPSALSLAYGELASDHAVIRKGLRDSAHHGTAKAIRLPVLAKTGTAPCTHARKAPGDGYVAVLYPAQHPKYVLLVQVHGVSGAVAATTAARMVTVLRDGK